MYLINFRAYHKFKQSNDKVFPFIYSSGAMAGATAPITAAGKKSVI
jgi:hypothetical protein